jgi:hypothetical protein
VDPDLELIGLHLGDEARGRELAHETLAHLGGTIGLGEAPVLQDVLPDRAFLLPRRAQGRRGGVAQRRDPARVDAAHVDAVAVASASCAAAEKRARSTSPAPPAFSADVIQASTWASSPAKSIADTSRVHAAWLVGTDLVHCSQTRRISASAPCA